MTSKEVVSRTIRFEGAERLPYDLPPEFGSDIVMRNMEPSPDDRLSKGIDEWGAVWDNVGDSLFGEVTTFPLKEWEDWDSLKIPDYKDPARWEVLKNARQEAGDKFLLGIGISLYERIHFLRGLENTWMDILAAPDKLEPLLDLLVEMNLYAVEKYAELGFDGYIWADDWGLQDQLMIPGDAWRSLWKERYRTVFDAVHKAGMLTFIHSCGEITEILGDFIEVGLDVIQMDQQENMGLERLGEEFGGKITFWSPVDIQKTMVKGSLEDIRTYCQRMVKSLGRSNGGFIPKYYYDIKGAGHRDEAVKVMSEEFLKLSEEHGEKYYIKK